MPTPKPDTPLRKSPAVDAFLAALAHPLASEVRRLRKLILAADPRLREGIKWNVPSFHHHDWFATFHLRSNAEVLVILHRGAKAKGALRGRFVPDPEGLVTWLANDRGKIAFRSAAEVAARSGAFKKLIHSWLAAMDADAA